jgi:acyl-coenzyme A synthetase/AMP-(fatty) acid ligase
MDVWQAGAEVTIFKITQAGSIMTRQGVQRRNIESLRICVAGGDVCLPGQQERFEELFGVPLRAFWAATEAPSTFTYVRIGHQLLFYCFNSIK